MLVAGESIRHSGGRNPISHPADAGISRGMQATKTLELHRVKRLVIVSMGYGDCTDPAAIY